MKQIYSLFAASALAAALPLAASAAPQPAPYAGLNYLHLDAGRADLDAAYIRGGAQLSEWVAVEGRAGTGIGDDSFGPSGARTEVELNRFFGGYVVAGVPNDSPVYPYAIVGYTYGKLDIKQDLGTVRTSTSESDRDFSYGLGADVRFTDQVAGNIEVVRYMDKSDVEFDGISVGVKMSF